MTELFRAIAESQKFQHFITVVILLAGVLVGLETYPAFVEDHGPLLHFLDQIVIAIFASEVVIKMGAHGGRPWRYFQDGWNVFDFLIVAACFMPVNAQYVTVLRLARLLRVLKLVRAVPKLQMLVSALLKSIPSMGYVSLLLGLLFYVYGVAAVFLFGKNDPVHFGNLQISVLSLFRVVTLEDWTDLMYINMFGCDAYGYDQAQALCTSPRAMPLAGAAFFVSFVLVGTMIILNLFIGVIMTGMDEAKVESEEAARADANKEGQVSSIEHELHELEERLALAYRSLQRISRSASSRPTAAAEAAPAE